MTAAALAFPPQLLAIFTPVFFSCTIGGKVRKYVLRDRCARLGHENRTHSLEIGYADSDASSSHWGTESTPGIEGRKACTWMSSKRLCFELEMERILEVTQWLD